MALYYKIIDLPDSRKMHKSPVAYLGGVAVFLGWVVGLAFSQFVQPHRTMVGMPHLIWPVAIVGAAAMIVALGFTMTSPRPNPG